MLTLTYKCTVCGESRKNLKGWLAHFLKESHLNLARKELRNWGEKERASTLVVFGLFPVGTNAVIPGQLCTRGMQLGGILLGDFVWWPERPNVGFARFRSRNSLEQIVTSLEKKGKCLERDQFDMGGNQYCHFKKASKMSEIEWHGLLPPEAEVPEPEAERGSSPEVQEVPVPRKKKVRVIVLGTPKKKKSKKCCCQCCKRRALRIQNRRKLDLEGQKNSGGGAGEQTKANIKLEMTN